MGMIMDNLRSRVMTWRGGVILFCLAFLSGGTIGVWGALSDEYAGQTACYHVALALFSGWAASMGYLFDMPTLNLFSCTLFTILLDKLCQTANLGLYSSRASLGCALFGLFGALYISMPVNGQRREISVREKDQLFALVLVVFQSLAALLFWVGHVAYFSGLWVMSLYGIALVINWRNGVLVAIFGALNAIPNSLPIPESCEQAMQMSSLNCSAAASGGMVLSWMVMVVLIIVEGYKHITSTDEHLRPSTYQVPPNLNPDLDQPLTGRSEATSAVPLTSFEEDQL